MDLDRLTLDGIRPLTVSIPGGKVPSFDPVTQRQLTKLKAFTDWIASKAPGKGCLGELGWPSGSPYTTVQAAQWNGVGEAVYQAADAAGLDVFQWGAATNQWAQPNGCFEGNSVALPQPGDPVRPLYTAFAQMGVINQHLRTGTARRGIAIATPLNSCPTANAAGSTWPFSNAREASLQSGRAIAFTTSATWEQSFAQVIPPMYNYGSREDYQALAALGFRSVRLPIRWERFQRTFNAALDATELARLDAAVQEAASVGIGITFSLHNFGGYMLDDGAQGVMKVLVSGTPGANQIAMANLTDFWTRLSAHYKAFSGTNLYSANDSGLETSVGNWIANANCTPTQSATLARTGTKSLRLSSTAAGDMSAILNATTYTVTPNLPHDFGTWVRAGATARYCQLQVNWYDAGNTLLRSDVSQPFLSATASWTAVFLRATAPATASYAKTVPIVKATGGAAELHYFDDFYYNGRGVEGYELMNEPGGMSQADWITESAAVVDAIRTTNGDTGPRLVVDLGGGGDYSNIASIAPWSAQTDWIAAHDSTGNYRYKKDFYFNDATGGGGGSYGDTYTTELASALTAGYVAPGFPIKNLSPTSATFSFFSTLSATPVVITGGTVAWAPSITFVAPASGAVVAEFEAQMAASGTLADTAILCIMDGATIKASRVAASVHATDATIRWSAVKMAFDITGLTPGVTYTYKPAVQVSNVRSTGYVGWGGSANPGSSARFVIKAGASGQYPGE